MTLAPEAHSAKSSWRPIVSVVIPARNEEAFIAKCIESMLVMDYPSERVEILVVDGASDGDVVRGVGVLHEDREVEPRRAAADGDDLHTSIVVARSPVVARTTRDSGAYNRG